MRRSANLLALSKLEMQEAKARVAEKLAKKHAERDARRPVSPPRYDEVFLEGVSWLDKLAGEEIVGAGR